MSGWNISSKISFQNNELWIAYKKAVRFISDYRIDETALLDLEFISWVTWDTGDIKFPVNFSIKK
jgi:hypothetical protein